MRFELRNSFLLSSIKEYEKEKFVIGCVTSSNLKSVNFKPSLVSSPGPCVTSICIITAFIIALSAVAKNTGAPEIIIFAIKTKRKIPTMLYLYFPFFNCCNIRKNNFKVGKLAVEEM